MNDSRLDFIDMVNISRMISNFNKSAIKIETQNDFQTFLWFKNHVCRELTLNVPTITSFQSSSLSFCDPLQILVLNTPLLEEFPYTLLRNQNRLQKLSLKSDVADELRYSFQEQRDCLQILEVELPSLTFLYWGIFRNLRESLIKLSLRNCSKLPEIPPTIGVLIHLQELDLTNCNLTDQSFPKQVAFLLNLQVLDIGTNRLTKIPDEIEFIPHLRSLCVCYNKITKLPPWIVSSEISALCVAYNDFTNFPSDEISNLSFFNYNGNTIKGDCIILSKQIHDEKNRKIKISSSYDVVYFSSSQLDLYRQTQQVESQCYDTIPKDLLCPITQSIMIDPVITCNGETYERYAIQKWFRTNLCKKDPLTNKRLKNKKLTPNFVLSRLIRDYVCRK